MTAPDPTTDPRGYIAHWADQYEAAARQQRDAVPAELTEGEYRRVVADVRLWRSIAARHRWHSPYNFGDHCTSCPQRWPCPDLRAAVEAAKAYAQETTGESAAVAAPAPPPESAPDPMDGLSVVSLATRRGGMMHSTVWWLPRCHPAEHAEQFRRFMLDAFGPPTTESLTSPDAARRMAERHAEGSVIVTTDPTDPEGPDHG